MTFRLPLEELRRAIKGVVVTPDSPGFAEETAGFNLANTYSPELAVGIASETDAIEAVRFARQHELRIRILATGHGPIDPVTDGMLIVTKRLDSVAIDPDTKIATIGAGVKWGAVQAAAAPFGLTAITGSSPDVGAIGLALGGGIGPLARSHGFTSDYVQSFRVVTGTGEVVTASDDENQELFWALRGGKGGLGLVTEMTIALVALPTIFAGAIIFDEPHIETVLRGWADWTASAPDDVTTSAAMIHFPPFETVPEPVRGHFGIAIRFAYPGSPEEGAALAEPLRGLAPALMDYVGELPTSQMGIIHSDPTEPMPAWDRGTLLNTIDQPLVTALLAQLGPGVESPFMISEFRHLGGATATDVPNGSAARGRRAGFTFYTVAIPNETAVAGELEASATRLVESLGPWMSQELHPNFSSPVTTWEQFADGWPRDVLERLVAVKKQYDPHALFTYGPVAR